MPTRKRIPLKGPALAFITTSVRNWIPIFKKDSCAKVVLYQLIDTCSYYQVAIVAYVIMPTHIHLLAGFKDISKMSKIMQGFKLLTSKKIKAILPQEIKEQFQFDGAFRMWQDRFDDLIIWSEKQFKIKIDYIHNNPVKSGLVNASVDFEYSSARDWLTNEKGQVPIDKSWTWQN